MAPSGNPVVISQVEIIELATDAEVAGNVSLSATQTIHLNGALSLHGDLSAQTTSPTGQITNDTAGSLDVVGHADLNAHTIDLGNQVGDHLSLNSLTITSDGSVNISEDGSATDVATQLTGTNTAHSLHLSNNGSITLVSGATFDVDGNLQLKADGVDANIAVDGSITSNDGNVDLLAGDQVTLGSAASISVGGNGALSIEVQGSGIDMADGSQLVVDQGSVLLSATGSPGAEIHLSQMHTGSGSTANFTVEATGDKEVRRLDVAMHDAAPVRFFEGAARVEDAAHGRRHGERAHDPEHLRQVCADEPLHRDVRRAVVEGPDVEHAHRVLALERRRRLSLPQKARARAGARERNLVHQLDGHAFAELVVQRRENDAHAAFAEEPLDAVLASDDVAALGSVPVRAAAVAAADTHWTRVRQRCGKCARSSRSRASNSGRSSTFGW